MILYYSCNILSLITHSALHHLPAAVIMAVDEMMTETIDDETDLVPAALVIAVVAIVMTAIDVPEMITMIDVLLLLVVIDLAALVVKAVEAPDMTETRERSCLSFPLFPNI